MYLRVLYSLLVVGLCIFNFDVLAGDRVANSLGLLLAVTRPIRLVRLGISALGVLRFIIDGGVPFLLLLVELGDEFLDVGDPVPAAVMLAAYGSFVLVLHDGQAGTA
jgi:hypothetical protein